MPRLKKKSAPLRGSVMQNRLLLKADQGGRRWLGIALRLGLLCAALAIVAGVAQWSWRNGWPQRQTERLADAALGLTQRAHFAVRDVVVEGRGHTDKVALYVAIGASAGAPIFAFDPAAANDRIGRLPWVASATVERLLPDVIRVRLEERVPIARWQHEGKTVVIDREGTTLPDARPEQFATLPLVVGKDAPRETQTLLDQLNDFPDIARITTSAVHVGGRRWNLYLQPKILVRLPEQNIGGAFYRLAGLIRDQKLLERDIVALDLRIPDRLIFEPAASPATPRDKEPSR